MQTYPVLIVEPAEDYRAELFEVVEQMGHAALCVRTLQEGMAVLDSTRVAAVMLNTAMPDCRISEAILSIRQGTPKCEVVVVSEDPDPREAEIAIKDGAWDYLAKPGSARSLALVVDAAARHYVRCAEQEEGTRSERKHFEGIVGESPQLGACLETVASAAESDANVLIKGETGTGKELVAWAIHNNSPRAGGNFVVVDCAALPETLVESTLLGHVKGAFTSADKPHVGLIKQADGGTLFLDEVGELPTSAQKSFLRVLEERRFRPIGGKEEIHSDFRLISATNRNLDAMVQQGRFREDLLFRLRSFAIAVPPLRRRLEDIMPIVAFHMPRLCERLGTGIKEVAPEFFEALFLYPWPGNVRELVNSPERALTAARTERILLPQHLPTYMRVELARASAAGNATGKPMNTRPPGEPAATLPSLQVVRQSALERTEAEYLRNLLSSTGGNMALACSVSRLSRSRLYSLLKKHGIRIPQ